MKNQYADFSSVTELENWLINNSINLAVWNSNQAKSVENLFQEIVTGESYIQITPPLRVVQVVQVLVPKGDEILLELGQELEDQRKRQRHAPPSEKMKPGEDCFMTAIRCLVEELEVAQENIQIETERCEPCVRYRHSHSYPGLRTQYVVYQVKASVSGLPPDNFTTKEISHDGNQDLVRAHYWGWGRVKI